MAWNACKIQCHVTLNTVVDMAAGKLNIVDLDHALSAGFATGFLLARMVARPMTALATFFALKSRVHSF
jgi:hypothetical protein